MPPENSPSFENMREHKRDRVIKTGKIVIGLSSSIDVVVRDLSATGAQLRIPSGTKLPMTFDLALPGDELVFPSRICWLAGDKIGVQFTGRPRPYRVNYSNAPSR